MGFTTRKYKRIDLNKREHEMKLYAIDRTINGLLREIMELESRKARVKANIRKCQSALDSIKPRLKCDKPIHHKRREKPSIFVVSVEDIGNMF